jgi:hypothetical protein
MNPLLPPVHDIFHELKFYFRLTKDVKEGKSRAHRIAASFLAQKQAI